MTLKVNPITPLASPLGEEGHEVAKGVQANWIHRGAPRPANPVRRHPAKSVCTRVRMIMILLFYVLSPFARGGRRLAVRTAMEHHIGALPRTPFPASRDFPSRGNEKMGGTGYCVTYDTDSQSCNADFISIAAERQSATLGLKCRQTYEPSGPKDRSILRTLPRNADFISIAAERQSATLGLKGRQT